MDEYCIPEESSSEACNVVEFVEIRTVEYETIKNYNGLYTCDIDIIYPITHIECLIPFRFYIENLVNTEFLGGIISIKAMLRKLPETSRRIIMLNNVNDTVLINTTDRPEMCISTSNLPIKMSTDKPCTVKITYLVSMCGADGCRPFPIYS
jgi:hypothetical protein